MHRPDVQARQPQHEAGGQRDRDDENRGCRRTAVLAGAAGRPAVPSASDQAVKFGALLERGEYAYDAHDHHGPTLYYLTLPFAWVRGQSTLASLDERTLRGVPAAFGAATIVLLPLLPASLGRTAVAAAALDGALSGDGLLLTDVHPGVDVRLLRAGVRDRDRTGDTERGWRWPLLAGTPQGWQPRPRRQRSSCSRRGWPPARWRGGRWGRCVLRLDGDRRMAKARRRPCDRRERSHCSFIRRSSLIRRGVLEPLRAAATYFQRGVGSGQPRARRGTTTSALLGLVVVGRPAVDRGAGARPGRRRRVTAWTTLRSVAARSGIRRRYLTGAAVLILAIYSAIPYKTPWNLLPFPRPDDRVRRNRRLGARAETARAAHVVWLAGSRSAGLTWVGSVAASVVYASDPRNPDVYAQTVPDAVRMAARIRDLGRAAPNVQRMPVTGSLRRTSNGRYPGIANDDAGRHWTGTADAPDLTAPVSSRRPGNADMLEAALVERYVASSSGSGPKFSWRLYVERGLVEMHFCRVPRWETRDTERSRRVRTCR